MSQIIPSEYRVRTLRENLQDLKPISVGFVCCCFYTMLSFDTFLKGKHTCGGVIHKSGIKIYGTFRITCYKTGAAYLFFTTGGYCNVGEVHTILKIMKNLHFIINTHKLKIKF